ncbi:aldehyde dehydrogenase family protein [Streptomyces sp. NPDC093097]|uniref:aldehyde dehydrogenase family protein n=1 Tax=Streptomyces sp. NPDC093097 TaxID=3366027 RepID=UPI0037FA602E
MTEPTGLAVPPAAVPPKRHTDQWIGGCWTVSLATEELAVTDPATERLLATVPSGTAQDADRAARAAADAFPSWSTTSVHDRLAALRRIVAGLEHHADQLAQTITSEVGAPQRLARRAQVGLAIGMAAQSAEVLERFAFEERLGHSLVTREPAGVAACITPWNMPLLLTVQKVLPALAAGCTVVHKPSELTPLHALLFAEIVAEADLPPGVFNMVVGPGSQAGAALAAHPAVDLVSLTGSTRAGRQVSVLGADTVKRVHLELGGKGASVVMEGADLEAAVRETVDRVCFNSGQACLQWSRLLVPRARHDEAVRIANEAMAQYVVGDPRDAATDLGPLVSAAGRERVIGHVQAGVDSGAELVRGGTGRPAGLERGYYVTPTLFARVDPASALAQEEIFGPVLSVIPHDGEDDAVAIANGTRYGLHSGVWADGDEHALRVARRLRTGVIDVNGAGFNPAAPFGGFKQSGIGRECGAAGLAGYLETKSVQLPQVTGAPVTGPRLKDTSAPVTKQEAERSA